MSKLLEEAKKGNAKFYLQFGGQGSPWYKELAKYYEDPAFKPFFDVALGAIDSERSRVEGTIGLPEGIDAKGWLDNADSIPNDDYLSCAAVSIPMIQMTQLAHVENLRVNGFPLEEMMKYTVALTGHSQGLIPACLLAQDLKGDEYYHGVSQYLKYLLYLGVTAQKIFPQFAATDGEINQARELGTKKGQPAPMVAVLGGTHELIQKMLDDVNPELPADKKIFVSLYNSSTNRIFSSYRSSLLAFHKKHKAILDEKKIKFVYLRTTCPFHCELMAPMVGNMEDEIKHIGWSYTGDDLKRSAWSFVDGTDMADSGASLPTKMYKEMAIKPLYWDKSVRPGLENKEVTHFLDFGPGKTSQRLSAETMADLGSEKIILAAGVPKDQALILGDE